jgi:Xaa-Pro aminopeptidase
MRWATKITVEGHIEVLRKIRDGQRESDLESIFKSFCELKYKTGRVQPYCSIVGCGPTAATLHYNDNNKRVNNGETMLIDQAHSVHHYASDITSSFPVNGKFTEKQAAIYNIVLKANREVMSALKAGSSWVSMQLLAERVIL